MASFDYWAIYLSRIPIQGEARCYTANPNSQQNTSQNWLHTCPASFLTCILFVFHVDIKTENFNSSLLTVAVFLSISKVDVNF